MDGCNGLEGTVLHGLNEILDRYRYIHRDLKCLFKKPMHFLKHD